MQTITTETYKPVQRRVYSKGNIAQRAAQFLIESRATVAFCYDDYQRVTAACRFEFGTDGESIAWEILENSPSFQVSKFRKDFAQHWRSFKRGGGNVITGGTLVHLAKEYGFVPNAAAALPAFRRSNRTAQRTQTKPKNNEPTAVLENEYGYPAAWDL